MISLKNVQKHFKVLNRREGLSGAFLDLFSRNYRYIKAVDGIDLEIGKGEIVGFIGPNGAGKSTAIKMMTGVLTPSSGEILVNGMSPFRDRVQFVRGIGVVFGQRTQLWWELPVRESFKLLKEIFSIPEEAYKRNLGRFEELVNIQELYGQQVRSLSLGQRMLCDIAASFLHDPSIIFLDEPTIGLDVAVKGQIRKLIRTLNEEKKTTIILTTHDIGDVEALCKRIVLIDKGKLIYDGDTPSFNRLFGSYRTLTLLCKEGQESEMTRLLPTAAQRFPGVIVDSSKADTLWFDITVDQDKVQLSEVLSWSLNSLPVKDVKIQEIRTESVISRIYEEGIS